MTLIEKMIMAHRLKKEVNVTLTGINQELVCIGDFLVAFIDHYEEPRLCVFRRLHSVDSAEFKLSADGIELIDASHFSGDLDEARALVEKTLAMKHH